MSARKIIFLLALGCCLITVVSAGLYYTKLRELSINNTQNELQGTAELISREFDTFLDINLRAVVTLSRTSNIIELVDNFMQPNNRDPELFLNNTCSNMGASICYVLDSEGTVVMDNTAGEHLSLKGNNYAYRPYFQEARDDGQSIYLALGAKTRKLGIYVSSKIESAGGEFIGVLVIKLPASHLEGRFTDQGNNGVALFTGPNGVIFASSRPEWTLLTLRNTGQESRGGTQNDRQFGDEKLGSLDFEKLSQHRLRLSTGELYFVGTDKSQKLIGWKVIYLKEESAILFGISDNIGAWLGFVILLMLTVLGVFMLYRVGTADLNQRKKAEQELLRSEERLRQIIEITNEAIILHQNGRIIDANHRTESMFGYSKYDLNSFLFWELLEPQSIEKARNLYLDNNTSAYEVNGQHADGRVFPIEIIANSSVFNGQNVQIACVRDVSERKASEKRIIYQAHYDQLTDLPNRNLMIERLTQAIKKSSRTQLKTAVMFIDLDDFKKINDSLGHSYGDELLMMAANRLLEMVRKGDTISRYGGDEFVQLVEGVNAIEDIEVVASKVLNALSTEFVINNQSFHISGSIGISVCPDDGLSVEELMQKADTAMYCSKEHGRNNYHFYTGTMNEHVNERLTIERLLRVALTQNQLSVVYQPIYQTQNKRLIGAEALLRWSNTELGSVAPDRFIPVAEQTGLIIPIGEWVINQVCQQMKYWAGLGIDNFKVSVNISPRQFRDSNLIPHIQRCLKSAGIQGPRLVVEITEGLLIKNDQSTTDILNALKGMGIGLSLDDFGTGFSALSYLKRFPFDTLKIDRSFVQDIESDASDRQLVQATVAMSKGLGLNVVAEGVETQSQLEFLSSIECFAVQGYLFSKPIDSESFTSTILQPALQFCHSK